MMLLLTSRSLFYNSTYCVWNTPKHSLTYFTNKYFKVNALKGARTKLFWSNILFPHLSISRNFSAQINLSWNNSNLQEYVKKFKEKYEPSLQTSSKEAARVLPALDIIKQAENFQNDLQDLQSLAQDQNEELAKMANEDIEAVQENLNDAVQKLLKVFLEIQKKFPTHGRNVILEFSAGVGGQEAMLFTQELWEMYEGYAYSKGWGFENVEYASTDLGGLRQGKALLSHSSSDLFSVLQFEGGIHRVQRVPKTERTGRVHTSTAAVAVLLQPTEVDVLINPKDLKIDTMKSSGAGGQSVNKLESAVRITHLPTGIVTDCQTERTQYRNKAEALQKLRALLYERELEKEVNSTRRNRKLQMGSRSRSEKIRTYNVQQDRVTDHRIGFSCHNVEGVLSGGPLLDSILQRIQNHAAEEAISSLLDSHP